MWPTVAKVIGFLLLLGSGFFYLVSGLVVPAPYLFILWALWLALLAFAVVKRDDWRVVLTMPFVSVGLWFGILYLGGEFLGWTA